MDTKEKQQGADLTRLDDLASFTVNFVENYNAKLRANPPRDDEEEDDRAFYDDPVYDHFTHRNLGIPE